MTLEDDVMSRSIEWRNECDNWFRHAEVNGTQKTIEELVTRLQTARIMFRDAKKQLDLIKKVIE